MYQTKNLGLNITEIDKDSLQAFNFDTDLGDNFKAIDEKTLSHRNITNCLLEVPQDIKLELVDGVLTLKKGSKVYVPNGFKTDGTTKKFDEIIIQNDLIMDNISFGNTENKILTYEPSTNALRYFISSYVSSGKTAPDTGGYLLWYDTVNNLVKESTDGGASWLASTKSFPLCRFTTNTTTILSIDQVFNGFGFIGSTVFALPGVKCLIPDGKNEDGSLRNIEYLQNTVQIFSNAYTATRYLALNPYSSEISVLGFKAVDKLPVAPAPWVRYLVKSENKMYTYDDYLKLLTEDIYNAYCICVEYSTIDGVISSFKPKQPFHAVDHNDYSTKIAELETKIATLQAAVEALQG